MAGVKESPRQKMIGMMYLVLTAMLALQVSNALLQKFQLLNNSLELSNGSANNANRRTVDNIKAAIDKSGNVAANATYGKQAQDVHKLADDMVGYIDGVKGLLIDAGGGQGENGMVKNPSEEEKVAIKMIGEKKAYELKDKLNEFTTNLQKYVDKGVTLPSLALDAAQDPMMSKTDQKNKDFANLNFAQTPVPAALATLSQKQSEIRRLESEALEALAAKVGAKEIKFDKVLAMVSPDARSVVAGTKYKAQMFIAAYSSGITPRMSINGSSVPVVDGKGQIEFTAQGGDYDKNGALKRSYRGSVSFQAPDGMKTLDINEEYTVLQPTVQIETATLPPLYFKCANRLSTYSPGLGGLYSPTFSGSGADFIPGGGGKVTIVPTSPDVAMNIVNGGNVLDTKKFRVSRVPKPQLVVRVNGAPADEKRGASASTCRVISVDAVADESFKRTNPEDAQYRVSDFEINLARGNRRIAGPSTSIGSMASQAQAGDRYVIIIRGVQRRNFRGEIEDVSAGEITRQVFLY